MGNRRYAQDGVLASVINYIISGVFIVAGLVFFAIIYSGGIEFTSLFAIFFGLGLANLGTVKSIYKDYDISNKFVRGLLGFASILGIVILLGGAVSSTSCDFPYVKVLAFSVLIGYIIKVFVANVNDFIPAFDAPTGDFFRYYSLLIFIAGTLAFFSIFYIFFDFYFTLLFVGNWILVYFILTDFRSWMEERKTSYLVYAIVFFVIGIGANLPIAIAINDLPNLANAIQEANLFNLASNLYFALAIVMGIGFTFLTRIDFVKNNMSKLAIEILLLVLPVLAFGVQFLVFHYFKVFLIVAGTVLLLVALVVLLFKLFIKLISLIGEFFVGFGKGVWYVISFKWITNQADYLTSSGKKRSSSSTASTGATSSDGADQNCHNCIYLTHTNPRTGMYDGGDYCSLTKEPLSYGDTLSGCSNFTKK